MNTTHAPLLAPNLQGLGLSATLAINEQSNALLAEGKKVFKLGLGQSPFPVPAPVVQTLRDAAAEKDYLPVRGLATLRKAVAAHQKRRTGIDYTEDNVIIGPGSKELLFLAQLVHNGPLLLPSPSWVSYAPQAKILGKEVHWLQTSAASRWMLRADTLRAWCKENNANGGLLLLNSPSNPTGYSIEEEELKKIAAVAREHHLLVLSDEIYTELRFDGEYRTIARYYPEGTLVTGGLSKWCGAGGWRLGTILAPQELQWMLNAMASVASETFTSVSAPIQYASVAAYQDTPEIQTYLHDERRLLKALGERFAATLRSAGAQVQNPEGGFYLIPDFSPLREKLAARGIAKSEELCARLLQDTGVAILPGSCFGRPSEELNARLAYVNFDGEAALEKLKTIPAKEKIGEDLLTTLCGETLKAAELIATWIQE